MNAKTAKLLRQYAVVSGVPYDEVKCLYASGSAAFRTKFKRWAKTLADSGLTFGGAR